MPDFSIEDLHVPPVAGVDEVGRGPLAGPVVAAAVILDRRAVPDGIDDSKRLTAARREDLAARLLDGHLVGLGEASVEEIERLNIRRAALLAMTRALRSLPMAPALALIDGDGLPESACPCRAIVGGDGLSLSVAAASIVAKVHRDALMARMAELFPAYGFDRHKGYGTAGHLAVLRRLGPTPIHRRSFQPVAALLGLGGRSATVI